MLYAHTHDFAVSSVPKVSLLCWPCCSLCLCHLGFCGALVMCATSWVLDITLLVLVACVPVLTCAVPPVSVEAWPSRSQVHFAHLVMLGSLVRRGLEVPAHEQ